MALNYSAALPDKDTWKSDSSVTLATRAKDEILVRIDELVEAVSKAGDRGALLYLLCDLFFTLDYWLKIYKSNSQMEKKREPAVMALYKGVVERLCTGFGCTVNVLPRELEYYFGRELHFHGSKLDSGMDCAIYLSRAEVHKYKLFFKHGTAYMFPWWDKSAKMGKAKFVKADSSYASNPDVFDPANRNTGVRRGHRNSWGGFAMSMGRDIYMAKHHCTKDVGEQGNFYHSSYLGGQHVMCAGTMLIVDGQVKAMATDSGHYRPTQNHVVNVLQTLQMHGVSLATIDIQDFYGTVQATGNTFIQNNGNWNAMISRRQANITHLATALNERTEFEALIKRLWEQGLSGGVYPNTMEGIASFASMLKYYTNRLGRSPFEDFSKTYLFDAAARVANRKPDAWGEWIFNAWIHYAETRKAIDSDNDRRAFANWLITVKYPVECTGWSTVDVINLLKKAYEDRRLPWKS